MICRCLRDLLCLNFTWIRPQWSVGVVVMSLMSGRLKAALRSRFKRFWTRPHVYCSEMLGMVCGWWSDSKVNVVTDNTNTTHPSSGCTAMARGWSSPSEMITARYAVLTRDTSIRSEPWSVQYTLPKITRWTASITHSITQIHPSIHPHTLYLWSSPPRLPRLGRRRCSSRPPSTSDLEQLGRFYWIPGQSSTACHFLTNHRL